MLTEHSVTALDAIQMDLCCKYGTMRTDPNAANISCWQRLEDKPKFCMTSIWKAAGCTVNGRAAPTQENRNKHLEFEFSSGEYYHIVTNMAQAAKSGRKDASMACFGYETVPLYGFFIPLYINALYLEVKCSWKWENIIRRHLTKSLKSVSFLVL